MLSETIVRTLCYVAASVVAIGASPPSEDVLCSGGPLAFSLRLDKSHVMPGDSVTLNEVIPHADGAGVTSVDHHVVRIGRYDRRLNKLFNLRPSFFGIRLADQEFDNLPSSISASHGFAFTLKTSEHKGLTFTFRPKHLGIYLIVASWQRPGHPDISSNPVVLVVESRPDGHGRSIVKPEWISEDD